MLDRNNLTKIYLTGIILIITGLILMIAPVAYTGNVSFIIVGVITAAVCISIGKN